MFRGVKWSGVAWDNFWVEKTKNEEKKASFYWEKSIRKCKSRVLIYAKVVKFDLLLTHCNITFTRVHVDPG